MKKLRICLIFGGNSAEHEVSLVSAKSIAQALNPENYDIVPIGITKTGRWVTGPSVFDHMQHETADTLPRAALAHDPITQGVVVHWPTGTMQTQPIDVVFPIVHGTYGEDGTLQGLLELSHIPYVGAGVCASAICLDKVIQRRLCKDAGLPVVNYVWFENWETTVLTQDSQHLGGLVKEERLAEIEKRLGFPMFVKPARLGSSIGITKVHHAEMLAQAISHAAKYDTKIIVESAVPFAREIEIAVLGNNTPKASIPGEIIPSNEFYDYNAKYVDGASRPEIPAQLSSETSGAMQHAALIGFLTCGCEGMARVDFLLDAGTEKWYLNEINTIPGFTSISMYPKLWQQSGVPYSKLLDTLIALALERHRRKATLVTSFTPPSAWHKTDAPT